MKILGLSFDYHDSAAALLVDGEIVAAAQEERFSRIKHDEALPVQAINFCLNQAKLSREDIDIVAFYERPLVKLDRILSSAYTPEGINCEFLNRAIQSWIQSDRLGFRNRIATALKVDPGKIRTVNHHQAHAASAFLCSPYDEATIVTLDGVGEWETMTVSIGKGRKIEKLYSTSFPDSIGLFYSAFTAFLGFEVNEGEYKVMGMAAFGKPIHAANIRQLVELTPDGGFRIDQQYFNFKSPTSLPFTDALTNKFGAPRGAESPFDVGCLDEPPPSDLIASSRHYADVAASVQLVTEELVIHIVTNAVRCANISQVVLAGGVGLNSLANRKLSQLTGGQLFVQPSAGDAGGALGAALWHAVVVADEPRPAPFRNCYLGESWDGRVEEILRDLGIRHYQLIEDFDVLAEEVAELLAQNLVVGWVQGRFEWGPRSLGARSILASPVQAEMKQIVNEKIKFREPFRPFAPSVLEEYAHEYFDIERNISESAPENFMLSVAQVREHQVSKIPAVTHADGSARVQLVRKEISPRFHSLISAFGRRTGIPILLNTSFNLRGEPIVSTPRDAINTFSWSGMDYLVMDNCLLSRKSISWL